MLYVDLLAERLAVFDQKAKGGARRRREAVGPANTRRVGLCCE